MYHVDKESVQYNKEKIPKSGWEKWNFDLLSLRLCENLQCFDIHENRNTVVSRKGAKTQNVNQGKITYISMIERNFSFYTFTICNLR